MSITLSPSKTMNNSPRYAITNVENLPYSVNADTVSMKVPAFINRFPIKLSCRASFSSTTSAPLAHIGKIVLFISKPQMGRINAGRIISTWAIMTNVKSIWNWTVIQNPTRPCGGNHFLKSSIYCPISIFSSASRPIPATICFFNLFPKAFRKVLRKSLRSQIFGSNLNHHRLCADRVTGPSALLLFCQSP